MKNLKRGLSFILVLAMVLGCFSSGMVAMANVQNFSFADDGGVAKVEITVDGPASVLTTVYAVFSTNTVSGATAVSGATELVYDDVSGIFSGTVAYPTVAGEYYLYATDDDGAKWTASTNKYEVEAVVGKYSVSYNANGGSGTMNSIDVDEDSSYTLPKCSFAAPSGKQFKGWSLTATGAVITTATITVTGNTTLYAIWEDFVFEHNINYAPLTAQVTAEPVKDTVYSEDAKTYVIGETYIDLVTEILSIPEGYSIAAYSIDGGDKWKTGTPGTDMSKLLNKDLELVLTNKYDSKNKEATKGVVASGDTPAVAGATVITFPKITGRLKADKLVVNYLLYAEDEQWILANKDGSAAKVEDIAKLQIAVADSSKKKPDENGWGKFDGGINIKPLLSTGKVDKTIYLVRIAPVGGNDGNAQAASAFYKVTASGLLAAPKLKADYKTEVIKVKAGIALKVGDGSYVEYAKTAAGSVVEVPKAGVSISGTLTEEETYAYAYTAATAKKPASAVQTITLAPRAKLQDLSITPSSGKIKLDKKYEVYDSTKSKYAGLPKIEAAGSVSRVRLKADVKTNKNGTYTGNAASQDGWINYTWGSYDSKKPEKMGIIAPTTLFGPEYNDGNYVLYLTNSAALVIAADGTSTDLIFGVKNAKSNTSASEFTASDGTAAYGGAVTINGFDLPKLTVSGISPVGDFTIKATVDGKEKTLYTGKITQAESTEPAVTIATIDNVTEIPAFGTLELTAMLSNIDAKNVVSYAWTAPAGSKVASTTATINADLSGKYEVTVTYKDGDANKTVKADITLTKAEPTDVELLAEIVVFLEEDLVLGGEDFDKIVDENAAIAAIIAAVEEEFGISIDEGDFTLSAEDSSYVNDQTEGIITITVDVAVGYEDPKTVEVTIAKLVEDDGSDA